MNNSKRIWVWVGVVIVAVVVIMSFFWKPTAKSPTASGPTPVMAAQGQLVPEFPASLILDKSAVINGSYAINYSANINQYTAEFNSSDTMASAYAAYQQYLPANGWTITNDIAKYSTSRGLSASNASSDLAVSIATANKGSQITITYVVK